MSIKTIEKNKLGNRTEELISILRDTHHMKICEGKNGIFCDDGRLMGFPVKIRILPQFGRASIFVYLGCSTIMKMEIMYMIDVPLEILLNNAVGRFEKELNQLKLRIKSMKQISVITVLQAWVPDDANLEEIEEKVERHFNFNEPDFRISEIKTQDENSDDELKEPWFRLKDSYVTEAFTLSIG